MAAELENLGFGLEMVKEKVDLRFEVLLQPLVLSTESSSQVG